jgi:hypothetical protein
LESLRALLKVYRKTTGKCPNTSHHPKEEEKELPSDYYQKYGNVDSFSLKHCTAIKYIPAPPNSQPIVVAQTSNGYSKNAVHKVNKYSMSATFQRSGAHLVLVLSTTFTLDQGTPILDFKFRISLLSTDPKWIAA